MLMTAAGFLGASIHIRGDDSRVWECWRGEGICHAAEGKEQEEGQAKRTTVGKKRRHAACHKVAGLTSLETRWR